MWVKISREGQITTSNKYCFAIYINQQGQFFFISVSNTKAKTVIKWRRGRILVVLRQSQLLGAFRQIWEWYNTVIKWHRGRILVVLKQLLLIVAFRQSSERSKPCRKAPRGCNRVWDEVLRLRDVELPVWDPRSRERRSSLGVSWRLLPIPVLCQTNFHTHILHANKQNVFFYQSFGYLKRTNAAKAYNYCWYGVIGLKQVTNQQRLKK